MSLDLYNIVYGGTKELKTKICLIMGKPKGYMTTRGGVGMTMGIGLGTLG